jgi:hypothetical protein
MDLLFHKPEAMNPDRFYSHCKILNSYAQSAIPCPDVLQNLHPKNPAERYKYNYTGTELHQLLPVVVLLNCNSGKIPE